MEGNEAARLFQEAERLKDAWVNPLFHFGTPPFVCPLPCAVCPLPCTPKFGERRSAIVPTALVGMRLMRNLTAVQGYEDPI